LSASKRFGLGVDNNEKNKCCFCRLVIFTKFSFCYS
ncbi:hypothetical protein D047_4194B, partial [Vibrio parahaemolyticus VPTS-2010_2]